MLRDSRILGGHNEEFKIKHKNGSFEKKKSIIITK